MKRKIGNETRGEKRGKNGEKRKEEKINKKEK